MNIDDLSIDQFFDRLQDAVEQAIMGTGDTGRYRVKTVIATSELERCNDWLRGGDAIFLNTYISNEGVFMYVLGFTS